MPFTLIDTLMPYAIFSCRCHYAAADIYIRAPIFDIAAFSATLMLPPRDVIFFHYDAAVRQQATLSSR